MRKCPKCKKAIPVGERRCVHCRTIFGETNSGVEASSTRMGFGARREEADEVSRGNATSFGRPGSAENLGPVEDGAVRGGFGRSYDASPNHTMIGLGPVSLGGRRSWDNDEDDNVRGYASTTIAGMPGVSFDADRRKMPVQADSRSQAATPQNLNAVKVNHVAVPAPREIKFDAAAKHREEASIVAKKGHEPASQPVDDPFFGLPGVAPKPSSLVDEEFIDLGAKLFGADFATGAHDADDEDGWDFDIPLVQEVKVLHALGGEEASHGKDSTVSQTEPAAGSMVVQAAAETADVDAQFTSVPDLETKTTGAMLQHGANILAIASGLIAIAWLFIPYADEGHAHEHFVGQPANLLLFIGALAAAGFDFTSWHHSKKYGKMLMMLAFVTIFIVLLVLMLMAPIGSWTPHCQIIGLAAVGNLICAILYYLKKS
ncbi:MAG: hypothetical protein FWC40_01535 [Proteobacteria bacterium]|nr:hypothetical protein [Pseudomonadota bacterium]